MQHIDIICVGNIREKFIQDGIKEYQKRLGAYCTLKIIEIKEQYFNDNENGSKEKALQKEGEQIILQLNKKHTVFTLCVEGEALSSLELAATLSPFKGNETCGFTFIIGSANGLSEKVKSNSCKKISLSAMTFTHQLARLLLMEQVYRAFSIITNGKYHR